MKNILKDLFYNFTSSSLLNVVLLLQFAIFFWVFCQVVTYYININTEPWVQNAKNDFQYYKLYQSWVGPDIGDDPFFIDNTKNALGEIKDQPEFIFMSINIDDGAWLSTKMLKNHFLDNSYDDFLFTSLYPGYFAETGRLKPLAEEIDGEEKIEVKLCRMEMNAVTHYIGQADGGRLFEEKDYHFNLHSEKVPVMMGAAYKPYFQIGDAFDLRITKRLKATVIGFLPENILYIADNTTEHMGYDAYTLDYHIILPYFDVEGIAMTSEERGFLQQNYYNYLMGTLLLPKDATDSQAMDIQKRVNEIYTRNSLYTVSTMNATRGIFLFQRETRQAVNIIFSLLIIMAGFNVFSLCLSLLNKINKNMQRYAIELMNGQSPHNIAIAFVLEILTIILFAAAIAAYFIWNLIRLNIQFLWLLLFIAGILLFPCVLIVLNKLRVIDTETLMRRNG